MELAGKIVAVVLTALTGQTAAQGCKYQWYLRPGQTYDVSNLNYPYLSYGQLQCYWYLYTDPGSTMTVNCQQVQAFPVRSQCTDAFTVLGIPYEGSYCWPFTTETVGERVLFSLTLNYGESMRFMCSVQVKPRNECDCGWSYRTKIVGGQETGVNEFPFMVSVVDRRTRSHACGGAIISPRWILTAAHCLDVLNPDLTAIVVGEHDFTSGSETNATAIFRVARFVKHPRWVPAVTRNDIGLIQINGTIRYSMRVGPVCLPFARQTVPEVGDRLTVIGWGTTSFGGPVSNVLLKTTVTTVPIERCQAAFPNRVVNDTQFCTFERGKDSCQMDSGGPILGYYPSVTAAFSVGIVSYGGVCAGDDPSVSTRVQAFLDWIKAVTQENFCIK